MAQMTREKTELGTDKQQLEGIFERIMPHLLNLYGSTATAKDFEIYATNATFEDPLMRAHGVDQIKSAFYTLPKVFGESRIEEYTVKENVTGPGKVEFIIDNKQHYKVFGKDVDLTTQIRLNVEDGKVVRHEDWAVRGTVVDNGTHLRLPYLFLGFGTIPILWDKKPLKNRDTVNIPFVGRAAEVTRRGSMLLTHAFMRFGKDPKP